MEKSEDREKIEWYFKDALIKHLSRENPMSYDEFERRVNEATTIFMTKREKGDNAYLQAMSMLLHE